MQTMLRFLGIAVVASLLWSYPMFAASQGTKVQAKGKKLKVQFIGIASWYGITRQGRTMANGKGFDRRKLTAASWYFPLGTNIRVVNVKNLESVIVTITDRGPNLRLNRIVDLSEAAADRLDYLGQGLAPVFLYPMANIETEAAKFNEGLIDPSSAQSPGELEAKAIAPAL
jgi:rare lipoprotein A